MNNLASMYMEIGRLDDARRYAAQAVEVEPNYLKGHLTLGFVYMRLGEMDLSEKEFKRALEINPDNQIAEEYLEKIQR
jgi:Tfp pilus assembly protein PilF